MDLFLLICNDSEFITNMRNALSLEVYGLEVVNEPDISALDKYSLIIIYTDRAPLYLYEIRQVCNTPIIVVDNDSSLVYQYLDQGADDYLTAPVSFKELVARCRAILRRSTKAAHDNSDEVRYEGLIISKESYDIRVQHEPVLLSSREFEIMYLLASNPNKVLTRNDILDQAFGNDYEGDLRCVDVHIKKIRDKVENPKNVWSIKTVRGVGYKFSI